MEETIADDRYAKRCENILYREILHREPSRLAISLYLRARSTLLFGEERLLTSFTDIRFQEEGIDKLWYVKSLEKHFSGCRR